MATTTPLIMIFSFFMASVLNQSFKGRTFFRIVLFLPVVIMMTAGATNVLETQMSGTSSYKDTFDVSAEAFTTQISAYLTDIGVSTAISDKIISITNTVYNIINLSGIQILIILTGMQSISPSLYEAAKVEGGTAWENFWKITFPMVSPLILTSFIYTIVDSFTSSTNGLMDLIRSTAFTNQQVALSSAMSILYFTAIAIIVGAVAWIVSKFVFYYDS
ncbi:MAG TPA: sugar ABC transporter permease [Ruminococcaceae bacterium]|nr:sugar ABC transporter permease [Oscillospiraceae bacterium]